MFGPVHAIEVHYRYIILVLFKVVLVVMIGDIDGIECVRVCLGGLFECVYDLIAERASFLCEERDNGRVW